MKRSTSGSANPARPSDSAASTAQLLATDARRAAVERWAAKQPDKPDVSEAVRRLVDLALAADQPIKRTPAKTAARAAELAAKAIDRASDPTATPDERTARKRRILKGPDMRQD